MLVGQPCVPGGECIEAARVFVLVEGAFRVPVDRSADRGATFSRHVQLFRGTAYNVGILPQKRRRLIAFQRTCRGLILNLRFVTELRK